MIQTVNDENQSCAKKIDKMQREKEVLIKENSKTLEQCREQEKEH
jgi:hypothetical protein